MIGGCAGRRDEGGEFAARGLDLKIVAAGGADPPGHGVDYTQPMDIDKLIDSGPLDAVLRHLGG